MDKNTETSPVNAETVIKEIEADTQARLKRAQQKAEEQAAQQKAEKKSVIGRIIERIGGPGALEKIENQIAEKTNPPHAPDQKTT